MFITSKYNGVCKVCRGRVFRGDRIEWVRGVRGCSHAACVTGGEPEGQPDPERIEPVATEASAGAITLNFSLTTMSLEQLRGLSAIIALEIARRPSEPTPSVVEPIRDAA